MPNITRLGRGAVRKVHGHVDNIFDAAKARLLGPYAGKQIRVHYTRELSLPGLFEAGSMEEGVRPDLDVLKSLLDIAGNYIDAVRERTKARVVNEINSALAQAKHGGMDREDYNDLLKMKLSEVFGDVNNHIHMIVDTEASRVKNTSVLDGIIGSNLNADVSDPVVFFVVVRDGDLCDECKRLHLMPNGVTPRLWKLSELGHGYHKKGEDSPKIGGLHPHCRCTLVTLMPGFGFDGEGKITFKKREHLELPKQRGLELSEKSATEPLLKTEGVKWDAADHPRDPETGEFIDHEGAIRASLQSNKILWRDYKEDEARINELIDHSRKVIRAAKTQYPELYDLVIKNPWLADTVELDENGNIQSRSLEPGEGDVESPPPDYEARSSEEVFHDKINFALREIKTGHLSATPSAVQKWWNKWAGGWPSSPQEQVAILRALGIRHLGLVKAALRYDADPAYWHTPIADTLFSPESLELRDLIERGHTRYPAGFSIDFPYISGLNTLMHGYKSHSNGLLGQLTKYIAHRMHYADDYKGSDNGAAADDLFDQLNQAHGLLRRNMRGTQQGVSYVAKKAERPFSSHDLAGLFARNLHLFDQWREHQSSLREKLHRENESGTLFLARAYNTNRVRKNNLLSSFSDQMEAARAEGGGVPTKIRKVYEVPVDSVALSFHHAGPPSWGDPRRGGAFKSEHEFLIYPHDESIVQTPAEEAYPYSNPGAKVLSLIPRDERGKLIRDPQLPVRSGVYAPNMRRGILKSESIPGRTRSARTIKGTVIKRSSLGVGKDIGGSLYLHRNYEDHLPDQDNLLKAKMVLEQNHPGFKYNALKVDKNGSKITFFNSPDFDTSHEPVAGPYVVVDGKATRTGKTDAIWHHKWLWVKDDYKGFDVDAAHKRSVAWLKIPNIDFTRIGNKAFWEQHYIPKIPVA